MKQRYLRQDNGADGKKNAPITFDLLFVIILIISSFFLWANLSEITQHVRGQGRIIPLGKIRNVQHLEGGIIREILIKEGDRVKAGQELFIIDNIDASTNRNDALIKGNELEIRVVRLKAEKDNYSVPVFSEHLKKLYPQILVAEQELFQARKQAFKKEIDVLEDQRQQKRLKLDNLSEMSTNLRAENAVALKQLYLNEKMVKVGSVSQSKYLDSQSRVQNFQTRISQIEKEIPIIDAEIKEIQNKLEQTYKENEAKIIEETNKTSFEKKQIDGRLKSFDDKVSRARVTAPVTGIINARYIDTIGGVIGPGKIMADILPTSEQLEIEGKITTNDRPKIYLGLPVKIRLSAYDTRRTNAIDGTLTGISADSFTDQRGQSFYKIKVFIKSEEMPENMKIFPGMMADLHITAGRVTILKALLKPFMDLKNNALRKI